MDFIDEKYKLLIENADKLELKEFEVTFYEATNIDEIFPFKEVYALWKYGNLEIKLIYNNFVRDDGNEGSNGFFFINLDGVKTQIKLDINRETILGTLEEEKKNKERDEKNYDLWSLFCIFWNKTLQESKKELTLFFKKINF